MSATDPNTQGALRHGPLTADMVPLLTAGSSVLVHTGRWAGTVVKTFDEPPGAVINVFAALSEATRSETGVVVGDDMTRYHVSFYTYIGERGPDGWITAPEGGWKCNPVPGQWVNVRQRGYKNEDGAAFLSDNQDWRGDTHPGHASNIIAFRPAEALTAHPPATGSGEAVDMIEATATGKDGSTRRIYIDRIEGKVYEIDAAPIAGRGDREAVAGVASANGRHFAVVNHKLIGEGHATYAEAEAEALASTAPPPQDEPFMYAYQCVDDERWQAYRQQLKRADWSICPGVALYREPPQGDLDAISAAIGTVRFMDPPMRRNPTGTNLLDAEQAEAMVRYMVEGLPTPDRGEVEPVAYCNPEHLKRIKREAGQRRGEACSTVYGYPAGTYRTPLYTTPPADDRLDVALRALEGLRDRALAMTAKHGNPIGSDYEQGQNDMGHRWVTSTDEALRTLTEKEA